MVTIRKIYYVVLLVLSAVFVVSCTEERWREQDEDVVTMRFYTAIETMSRAQSSDESRISQIDAVVFVKDGEEYRYSYRAQGDVITDVGNNVTSFVLTLRSENRPVKIYFYANAGDALDKGGMNVGDAEEIVKGKISFDFKKEGLSGNLPMWAEHSLSLGVAEGIHPGIVELIALRAVARVDVLGTDVSDVFTMTSVQLFRAESLIQMTPDQYDISTMEVGQPSVPDVSSRSVNTNQIVVTENSLIAGLYIPETSAPTDVVSEASCVVVGGRYRGSEKVTYYRLDFGEERVGQILRNNLYTFNITSVTSDGWNDPESAANNIPSNITVTNDDWTDNGQAIGVGGHSFFWIKKRDSSALSAAGAFTYFPVSTNILDYTLQWCDSSGNAEGIPAFALENADFRIIKGRNSIIAQVKNDNAGGGEKISYVLIGAGRARIMITVRQSG